MGQLVRCSPTRSVACSLTAVVEIFHLSRCHYEDMSPVVIPPGYTRDFLDGKITLESQLRKIRESFDKITAANDVRVACGLEPGPVGVLTS